MLASTRSGSAPTWLKGSGCGVNQTPTFFIAGKLYGGMRSYDALKAIVDSVAQNRQRAGREQRTSTTDEQEVTKRMIVAALALAGIFISLYLTLYKIGVIGELSCSIGSCETVNTSKWATFLGLPVAAWGLFFYLDVFAIALVGTLPRFESEPLISLVLTAETAVGVLFSAWLTYLELGVIHAICIWCVTSACVVTLIFLTSALDLREMRSRERIPIDA